MKFFTRSELEEYYDSNHDDISPVDKPVKDYLCGYGVMICRECNNTLETKCSGFKTGSMSGEEFIEIAYCDNCEIQYERSRDPVSSNVDYQYQHHRTDEREEYLCKYCNERHCITQPTGVWNYNTEAQLFSYESIGINCPCGKQLDCSNVEIPVEIDCSECSRVFNFSVINEG